MGGLVRTKHVCTYIHMIHTQARGDGGGARGSDSARSLGLKKIKGRPPPPLPHRNVGGRRGPRTWYICPRTWHSCPRTWHSLDKERHISRRAKVIARPRKCGTLGSAASCVYPTVYTPYTPSIRPIRPIRPIRGPLQVLPPACIPRYIHILKCPLYIVTFCFNYTGALIFFV